MISTLGNNMISEILKDRLLDIISTMDSNSSYRDVRKEYYKRHGYNLMPSIQAVKTVMKDRSDTV